MKHFAQCWGMEFENKEYKTSWLELDPISKRPFKLGTVREQCDENKFSVYDGATNYMGYIDLEGHLYPSSYASSYVMSFLNSAKKAIETNYKKLG